MGYAYPIDSKVVTNPNGTIDYDRAYSSTQLRGLIKSMITNGVNLTESTNLQVMAEGETMNVIVKPGFAIIEGAVKQFEDDVKITIPNADETNPRIDTIVARLNLNDEVRDMVIDIIQGIPTEEPVAPTLSQNTSTYYEIGLADILVEVGATQISQEVITDTRLLNSRCGLATSIGEIDTETLFVQLTTDFDNWFESIKGKLGDDVAGNLQLQINGLADDIDTLQDDVESLEGDTNSLKDTLGYTIIKNLLENTGTTTTKNGITFTVNDDGSITANGTATATTAFRFAEDIALPNGEYILSGCAAGGDVDKYYLYMTGTDISGHDVGKGKTFVISDNITIDVDIYVISGQTVNNVTFYPTIIKSDQSYSHMKDVDSRLEELKSALTWKLVKSDVKGTTSITLPSEYNELFIEINIIDKVSSATTSSAYSHVGYMNTILIKPLLTSTTKIITLLPEVNNGTTSGTNKNYYVKLAASLTSVALSQIFIGSTSYTSNDAENCKLTVYYR